MLKKGIKQKLVLSLVITTLIVMVVFFLVLDRYLKDYSISEAERTILFWGRNASSSLEKPLFNSDYNQLKNIAQPVMLGDFDYLLIFDNSTKNVAFKEDKKGISDLLQLEMLVKNKSGIETTTLNLKGENYTQYLFPVTSPGVGEPLGYLIIGVSLEKMKSKLAGMTYRILMVSVLIFLTLTLTIFILSDRIVKPLKELSSKIGAFASGDYGVRSDIKTGDEIGRLSDNFNIMADKINEQILSIEQYSKNLEKMVQERTDELLKALDAIKEKDSKLNRAEKINSLNSIVSAIAHEINNPLAIISGNIQLIESKVNLDDLLLQKKLKAANDAIQRIANLIDEINFFSAIKDISVTSISFGSLLSTVTARVVPEDLFMHIDGSEEDQIDSNANLLAISLENILKNSVQMIRYKNIADNGKINIRYYRDPPFFVVEVVDNAGGIDEPQKIFDPFYTTFSDRKGLGLTFVYHAVQALNGDIRVENVEDGAKVSIMLPVEIPEEESELWLP